MEKVNWSGMVWELIHAGLHPAQIARKLHVNRTTVIRWRDYNCEPFWTTGNRLIGYWSSVTGKSQKNLPML